MKRVFLITLAVSFFAFANVALADTLAYDASLVDPPGYYNGTGGINSGFTVDTDGNLELGLSAILRFIGPITPVGNDYAVPLGGDPAHSGDAYWNFSFSVNTQAGGGTDVLSNFVYSMTILDENNLSTFTFDPTLLPDNSYWNGVKTMTKDLPNESGFQNSENLSFGFLPGFDPNSTDSYLITLSAIRANTIDLLEDPSVTIEINGRSVAATPEPGSLGLFGSSLLAVIAIVLWRRKRPQKS